MPARYRGDTPRLIVFWIGPPFVIVRPGAGYFADDFFDDKSKSILLLPGLTSAFSSLLAW